MTGEQFLYARGADVYAREAILYAPRATSTAVIIVRRRVTFQILVRIFLPSSSEWCASKEYSIKSSLSMGVNFYTR